MVGDSTCIFNYSNSVFKPNFKLIYQIWKMFKVSIVSMPFCIGIFILLMKLDKEGLTVLKYFGHELERITYMQYVFFFFFRLCSLSVFQRQRTRNTNAHGYTVYSSVYNFQHFETVWNTHSLNSLNRHLYNKILLRAV